MISYQKSLEDQQRENDALKCDNSMIKEELLVLGKRKLDQIQQACATKASQISELDRNIHSLEEKLYMLTHQTKLLSKDEEEYQRQYHLNVDKRDQLAARAQVLVDQNSELNRELADLVETDEQIRKQLDERDKEREYYYKQKVIKYNPIHGFG